MGIIGGVRLLGMIAVVAIWTTCALAEVVVTLPDGQVAKAVVQSGRLVEVMARDGTRLIGVDMAWYAPVAARAGAVKAGELSEEDRKSIQEICGVPSFYDRCEILLLQGDADRAVGLMQLVRDRDFHAGKGEVIWRAELWYFEFQNGGWAKVSQQNKVLDRQRFTSREKYLEYVRPIRFVPKLGGIKAGETDTRIELSGDDLKQSVCPGEK